VLLDGRTLLRKKHATLRNQQREPSLKFGTSDEFGSVILLLSNKDVQLAGSQSLTQGQMTHSLLPKKNGASARQPKLPSIVREAYFMNGENMRRRRSTRARPPMISTQLHTSVRV
jgi:hypothetical protein